MRTIFVMIKAELGQAYKLAERVIDTEQVAEVHSISGQYDLLIKAYLDDEADAGHFVTEFIQALPGVKDTFTLIAFKAFA